MVGPILAVLGGIVALLAWAFRLMVFDAINELRASRDKLGERLGKLEARMDKNDAVQEIKDVYTMKIRTPVDRP